jgi:hypothetical protein
MTARERSLSTIWTVGRVADIVTVHRVPIPNDVPPIGIATTFALDPEGLY